MFFLITFTAEYIQQFKNFPIKCLMSAAQQKKNGLFVKNNLVFFLNHFY